MVSSPGLIPGSPPLKESDTVSVVSKFAAAPTVTVPVADALQDPPAIAAVGIATVPPAMVSATCRLLYRSTSLVFFESDMSALFALLRQLIKSELASRKSPLAAGLLELEI